MTPVFACARLIYTRLQLHPFAPSPIARSELVGRTGRSSCRRVSHKRHTANHYDDRFAFDGRVVLRLEEASQIQLEPVLNTEETPFCRVWHTTCTLLSQQRTFFRQQIAHARRCFACSSAIYLSWVAWPFADSLVIGPFTRCHVTTRLGYSSGSTSLQPAGASRSIYARPSGADTMSSFQRPEGLCTGK